MVDRVIPVAGRDDLISFQNLFMSNSKRKLTDSHLWISIFSRPHRSNFTRVQRLSCILSLIMTTMMANAMFYQTETQVENKEEFTIGPFRISLFSIYVSFVSSMVVLPINLLIDNIFRKTKPSQNKIGNSFISNAKPVRTLSQVKLRPWMTKDDTKLTELDNDDDDVIAECKLKTFSNTGLSVSSSTMGAISSVSIRSDASLIKSERKDRKKKNQEIKPPPKVKPKKKKFSLPHKCVYIAWTLVLLSTFISAFITFLYSMEWGKEKSLGWLSSILLSIGESIVVIQPFKVNLTIFYKI